MATRQREKAAKIAATRDKRPTAIARNIRMPMGKAQIVLDLIRGHEFEHAAAILQNTHKAASPVILKVLNSAAANAENNLNMSKDNLYVAECWAMPGLQMKRMMPRARGRADRYIKYTCHIRVILDEKEVKKPVKKEVKKQTPKTESERPLNDTPNTKKPLGEKKVETVKSAPKPKPAAPKADVKPAAKAGATVKKAEEKK